MSAEIKLPTLTWQSSIKQLQGEKEQGRSLIRYNTFHFGNIDGHNYLTKKKKLAKDRGPLRKFTMYKFYHQVMKKILHEPVQQSTRY